MIEWIRQPWPWYAAGPMISFVMFLLLYFGKKFGISSNLRTVCSMAGAGRYAEYFRFDWRTDSWNLVFVLGTVLGGLIAKAYLMDGQPMALAEATITQLTRLNVEPPATGLLPESIFSWAALSNPKYVFMIIGGGIFVGFGTRYAGGCTSGHAISGLSDLQLPSLIAVVGFFVGGLLMTHLILPFLLTP